MSIRPVKVFAGIACATAVVAAGAFGATAANADPLTNESRTYVAVGSDTIQSIYDSFSNGYSVGTTNKPALTGVSIASWLATGSATIATSNSLVPTGAAPIGRPTGSGDGRAALSAAWDPDQNGVVIKDPAGNSKTYAVTPHSIDIARSSGLPSTIVSAGGSTDNLTSVPLARDAVAVAINDGGTSTGITNVSTNTIAALYGAPNNTTAGLTDSVHGNYAASSSSTTAGDVQNVAGAEQIYNGTAWIPVTPYLPANSGSGTRKFFLGAIGIGSTFGSWVKTTDPVTSKALEENTGSLVPAPAAGAITFAPFSAGQWIAQKNGVATNTITDANIHILSVNGLAPVTGSVPTLTPGALYGSTTASAPTGFGVFDRDVFSVVATAELTDSTLKNLVSVTLPTSANVADFGFEPIPAVAAASSNWVHSPWEGVTTAPAISTATSLTVSSASATGITLKANVSGPTGYTINKGTVTFSDGATVLGTADVSTSGVASFTTAPAAGATHSYSASYAASTANKPAPTSASTSGSVSVFVPAAATAPVIVSGTATINGTAKVGSTLTASVSGATAGSTFSYQWLANGAPIAGADSSKLVVPASASGKTVTVKVHVTADASVSADATSAGKKIAAGTLKGGAATIVGTAKVGQTLVAVNSTTWTAGTKISYQWYSNGKALKTAKKQTLKLSASLKGKKISVKVTGKLAGYTSLVKASKTTKAVAK